MVCVCVCIMPSNIIRIMSTRKSVFVFGDSVDWTVVQKQEIRWVFVKGLVNKMNEWIWRIHTHGRVAAIFNWLIMHKAAMFQDASILLISFFYVYVCSVLFVISPRKKNKNKKHPWYNDVFGILNEEQ